jgi:hypothetical protein
MAYPKNLGNMTPNQNQQQGVLPKNQVAMFFGPNAETSDPVKQAIARQMESSGYTPGQIYHETGLFKHGPSGQFLSYSPDTNVTFNQDAYKKLTETPLDRWEQPTVTFDQLIDKPDLFKAYPQLAKAPVNAFYDQNGYRIGGYYPDTNKIDLNMSKDYPVEEGFNTRQDMQMGFLLHEGQHGVQTLENKLDPKVDIGGAPYYSLFNLYNTLSDRYESGLPPANMAYDKSQQAREQAVQDLTTNAFNSYMLSKGTDPNNLSPTGVNMTKVAYPIYDRLAGEVQGDLVKNMYMNKDSLGGTFYPGMATAMQRQPDINQINPYEWSRMPLPGLTQKTEPVIPTPESRPYDLSGKIPTPTPRPADLMGNFADSSNRASDNYSPRSSTELSTNYTGGYGRPGGDSDTSDNDTETDHGGAFSSSYNAREKRGGRIW